MKSKYLLFTATLFILFNHLTAQTPERVFDNARRISVVGDKLFLEKYNPETKSQAIWVSDGTETGTKHLKDISVIGSKSYFEFNGKVYFLAVDAKNNAELWASDGTSAGTYLVKNLKPANSGSYILAICNNKMYLSVNGHDVGVELWVSDGTENGTKLFKDIVPGEMSGLYYSEAIAYKDKLYFSAITNYDEKTQNFDLELWVSDGTEDGTKLFKDLDPNGRSFPNQFAVANDKVFFNATTKNKGESMWISDGTETGTVLLKDKSSNLKSAGYRPIAFNGKTYFMTRNNGSSYKLWVTDGTEAGTFMLEDSVGYHVAEISGELLFSKLISDEDSLRFALYKTNGESGDARLVKYITGGSSSGYPVHFREANGKWYFAIYDNKDDYDFSNIWETDGTPENTKLVRDNQGKLLEEYRKYDLMSNNNALLFVMDNPGIGYTLHRLGSPNTAVTEIANHESGLVLFPNPASHQLTIKTDEKLIGSNYSVLNIMGQTVRSGKINSDNTLIEVGSFPGGTYFVQIQSKGGSSVSRFIKE